MYEIALVSSRKSKLEEQAKYGKNGARVALQLLAEPEKILSSIQVGITLIGIISGAFGGLALAEDIAPLLRKFSSLAPYADELSVVLVVGVITYLSLIIGELVPKTIALNNPEKITIWLSPAMKILGKVFYPVVSLLSISTRLVLALFRVKKQNESPISEEELRMLLKQGSEQGIIEKEESTIINEVIRFGDKHAASIMTHRVDVEWIDNTLQDEEIISAIQEFAHSRLPVISGSIDKVLGIVHVKDVLTQYYINKSLNWTNIITDPLYLPEQMTAIKVLELFRSTKKHFGIVVNEYGAMEGILTLHDLIENIIGDLPSLDEAEEIFRREDGSFLVGGSVKLEDIHDLLDVNSLVETDELKSNIETIGGLIMYKLHRIPQVGDKLFLRNHFFEVVDMDGNRVDKILISSK